MKKVILAAFIILVGILCGWLWWMEFDLRVSTYGSKYLVAWCALTAALVIAALWIVISDKRKK